LKENYKGKTMMLNGVISKSRQNPGTASAGNRPASDFEKADTVELARDSNLC
jgi:hypothetical protein